jgi:uncharacterized protein (TIGR04552 family)
LANRDHELALVSLEQFTLEDLEAVRLLLRGGSVIDWHRLDFRDHEDVDRFLRVNEFDPDIEEDIDRLEELRQDAIEYLAKNFDFPIGETLASEIPARDLFLVASREGPQRPWACVILKVMHIIQHLAGRELLSHLPVSSDEVYRAVELKVMRVVEELRASGYPIVEFEWSRKGRDSLITKLLVKRTTLAANIYDKLRFRMIVRNKHDVVPMLVALHRRLIPFNYVVPGQSINHLVSFDQVVDASTSLQMLRTGLQRDLRLDRKLEERSLKPLNEFSSPEYRIINFVADLPVRVDELFPEISTRDGRVVFVLTEFQLADKRTAADNETGPASHASYKARQYGRVRRRLLRGRRPTPQLPVPRGDGHADGDADADGASDDEE